MSRSLRLVPVSSDPDGYVSSGLAPAARRSALIWAYVLTVGRLPIGGVVVWAVFAENLAVVIAATAVFILVDLYDGHYARENAVETGRRRATDGVLDKLCVHAALLSVATAVPEILGVWSVMVARDALQFYFGVRFCRWTGMVAAGATWHRPYSLAMAGWGIAVFYTGTPLLVGGCVSAAYGFLVLFDYVRQLRTIDPQTS